ncbi:tyrosinase family oxidase copper chaperone [Micromonospora sp. CPCC 206061]|uniref:tyrosinase family oxidase copper chaperone n=1 Tax=Micromonospora sp. CPCC 206061 TaxID=3122410 RepID=UPI002FEEC1EE
MNRRDALRYGAAAAAVIGSAVGAQILATSSSAAPSPTTAPADPDPRDFELDYRGKKIKGAHGKAETKHSHQVHINGRKLAVMPIELPAAADASGVSLGFISALNHYEPVLIDEDRNKDGLLKLARQAVDALGDSELTALASTEHDHGR